MKLSLTAVLALVCLTSALPLAAASGPIDTVAIDLCPTFRNTLYNVCVDTSGGCVYVAATVYPQTLRVQQTVPGQDVRTKDINVGPVHVDGIHIWTDPQTVGPYYVNTPGRSVSNELCTDEASSVVAPFLPAIAG